MTNKLTLDQVVAYAKLHDAATFDQYLRDTAVNYEYDTYNPADPNEGWYVVRLFDFGGAEISFTNGGFDLVVKY